MAGSSPAMTADKRRRLALFVMPALVAGIHVFAAKQDVDGRDEPGQARP